MKIGLVRRGFSRTGGAESYLKRLGRALSDAGHQLTLFATEEWPAAEMALRPAGSVQGILSPSLCQIGGCSPALG